MRRQATSLRSVTTVLLASGLAGGLAACGGGSGGGSSPPPMPIASGEALDAAIVADPPSTAPDILSADGSGTPAENSMLEETTDAAGAKIDGWADTVYERTNETDSTDTFVVYSNQEAPKDTPFSDVYPFDNDADTDSVNDSVIVDTSNVSLVSGVAEFPSAVNQVDVPFVDDDEFTGMFDGVQGTYTCVSMCTLSTNSDAELVSVGGEWHFTPDDSSDVVPVDDTDYVHFGYWMNESEENDQSVIVAAAFAGGTAESPIGDVQSLEGSATYAGAATGLYVIRTFTLDGEIQSRAGGQFTADAALTAYFGGNDVAVNKHYSIVGTIEEFVDQRGSPIDSSWSVELEAARFGSQPGAVLTGTNGNVFGGTTEGDQGMVGAWSGRFFGPVAVPSTFPSAVAGTFDAQFTNGAVIGSFGAAKED